MTIKTWKDHKEQVRAGWTGKSTVFYNKTTRKVYFPVQRTWRSLLVATFAVAPKRGDTLTGYRQFYYAGGKPLEAKSSIQHGIDSRPTTPHQVETTTPSDKKRSLSPLPLERPVTPFLTSLPEGASTRSAVEVKAVILLSKPSTPIASKMEKASAIQAPKVPENDSTCCNVFGWGGCCIVNPIYGVDFCMGASCMQLGEETSACVNEGNCYIPKEEANDCKGNACKGVVSGTCYCIGTACFCLNKAMSVLQRGECPTYHCGEAKPGYKPNISSKMGGKVLSTKRKQSTRPPSAASTKYRMIEVATTSPNAPGAAVVIDTKLEEPQNSAKISPANANSSVASTVSKPPSEIVTQTSTGRVITIIAPSPTLNFSSDSASAVSAPSAGPAKSTRRASFWTGNVVATKSLGRTPSQQGHVPFISEGEGPIFEIRATNAVPLSSAVVRELTTPASDLVRSKPDSLKMRRS